MTYNTTKVHALKSYPTYQFYARAGSDVTDSEGVFKICILEAMKWVRARLEEFNEMPKELIAPEPDRYEMFTCEGLTSFCYSGGVQIDVSYIDTLGVWSLRMTEPDMGANLGTEKERPAVNGRSFATEIAFCRNDAFVEVGIRIICSEPADCEAECEVFRPRIMKALAENKDIGLIHGGFVIDGQPLEIVSKSDLNLFFEILNDSLRSMPLVIVTDSRTETVKAVTVDSLPADITATNSSYSLSSIGRGRQENAMQLTIDPELIKYKTNVIRAKAVEKKKTKKSAVPEGKPVTKKLPVFDYKRLSSALTGFAVVVFAEVKFLRQIANKTRIELECGEIAVIPRGEVTERYGYSNAGNDSEGFYKNIKKSMIAMAKRSAYSFEDVLFYSDAKLKEYHTKRKQTGSLEEECNFYKLENAELKTKVRELSQQQTDLQQIAESLRAALKKIESLNTELGAEREKSEALAKESALKESAYHKSSELIEFYKQQLDIAAAYPTDKKDICDWIGNNFSNEIRVAPRAQSEMRKYSGALDITCLCDGVVYLDAYAKYRRREISEEELARYAEHENWEVQGCGSGALRTHRSDYTVTCDGAAYTIDLHIKHGIRAEELIRIYFCWDEENGRIIIGSMPGHLATIKKST